MKTFTYHDPSRRGTVVGLLAEEGLRLGVAVKNEKDTFNRKLGRRIAMGRAEKNPWKVLVDFNLSNASEMSHAFYATAQAAFEERLTAIIHD